MLPDGMGGSKRRQDVSVSSLGLEVAAPFDLAAMVVSLVACSSEK